MSETISHSVPAPGEPAAVGDSDAKGGGVRARYDLRAEILALAEEVDGLARRVRLNAVVSPNAQVKDLASQVAASWEVLAACMRAIVSPMVQCEEHDGPHALRESCRFAVLDAPAGPRAA